MSTVNPIDIGSLPNDGTGDPLRVAFAKINDNFTHLGNLIPAGPTGALQFIDANGFFEGSDNLVFDSDNTKLRISTTVVPNTETVDLGTTDSPIRSLYLANTFALGNISISENANLISFPVSVLPSRQADIHINDAFLDGNISITGALNIEGLVLNKFSQTTSNNDANQVVFSFPMSSFNTGEFQLTSRSVDTNDSQTVTLSVTKKTDNTGVKFSAFGTVFNGDPITRYNVDYGYSNVRILVSPMINSSIEHTGTYQISVI